MSGFDKSDPWDMLVNIEGEVYEKGIEQGRQEALSSGIFEEGVQSGFIKGFSIGLELGFMENAVNSHLPITRSASSSEVNLNRDGNDKSSSSSTTASVSTSTGAGAGSRLNRRRAELSTRAASIPNKNVATVDFDQEILDLRSLYRQSAVNTGPFLPKSATEESKSW